VIAPWDAASAKGLLKAAIRDPNPVIFLENEILLSFGSSLLKNETTREVFKKMPLGSYFLESDESDDEIETIFAEAATLSELPLETIQFNLEQQFNQLFTR
jgi:pyruvate/2-oxoglutarate/acetoin dehydrogenase E1 component